MQISPNRGPKRYVVNTSTDPVTEEVALGKHVWERANCIIRHSLHGEGLYFAPEVGNVMTRWGVIDDPEMSSRC